MAAFMLYPLLFGYIADSACLIWEEKCGKTGNCWVYDHDKFRTYLHGTVIAFTAIATLFDFLMIFFAGRVQSFYDEQDDDAKAEQENGKNHTELNNLAVYLGSKEDVTQGVEQS